MSEIPLEIEMHAERLYDECGYASVPTIIAIAILAERERCAAIAEDHSPVFCDMEYEPVQSVCSKIADAIRGKIESGANAAANSPALEVSEASPTRKTITTEGKSNV